MMRLAIAFCFAFFTAAVFAASRGLAFTADEVAVDDVDLVLDVVDALDLWGGIVYFDI